MINKNIGIIGCGNMGEAILIHLLKKTGKSSRILVSEADHTRREILQKKYNITVTGDNNSVVKDSDVIILAVKPKDFKNLLEEIRSFVTKDKLIISIAAGRTTKSIENIVGRAVPVVRVMPNMPAFVGEAVSSLSGGVSAGKAEMEIAREVLSAIGDVVEVDEDMVDSVTALSGSGPAYFFYFLESLIEAAAEIGMDVKLAQKLALKTMSGSSKLLESLKESPAVLRAKVTSKGGTTEAAFKVFESKKFKDMVKVALKEACKRSKELSKE